MATVTGMSDPFNKRKVTINMTVKPGEMVVLDGLRRHSGDSSSSWFRPLPMFGSRVGEFVIF